MYIPRGLEPQLHQYTDWNVEMIQEDRGCCVVGDSESPQAREVNHSFGRGLGGLCECDPEIDFAEVWRIFEKIE